MRFHWIINDAINTIHYRDIIFGHQFKGIIWDKRRPDYVTITRKEVENWNKEIKRKELEQYMYDVKNALAYSKHTIHIYIN